MIEKTGRNNPCPCGSGKKYKKCCLLKDNIESGEMFNDEAMKEYQNMIDNWDDEKGSPPTFMEYLGKPNLATSSIHDMGNLTEGQDFQSVEELQAFMNEHMQSNNNAPLEDFLGLSPAQMQSILSKGIDDNKHILKLNIKLPSESFKNTPALKQILYLLNEIGKQEKGIKATQKGNLPRALVQKFYETYIKENDIINRKPMMEDDVKDIQKAKYFLKDSGFIKFQKGKYSITVKGGKLLNCYDYAGIYLLIFHYFAEGFNWLYGTRYPDAMGFIQNSVIFCLYLINAKANDFVHGDELAEIYINAFPRLAEDTGSNYGETLIQGGFCYLFCEDFAYYLGLMDMKAKKKLLSKRESEFKTTELFKEFIIWKVPFDSIQGTH